MQTDRRDVKTKSIFSFVFSSALGGVRRGAQEGGVQSGSEGFRSRGGSNICWSKKFLAPVGSEIFQPKVHSCDVETDCARCRSSNPCSTTKDRSKSS